MSLETVLAAVIPSLLVALLGGYVNRVHKDRDSRIEKLESNASACADKAHESEVKLARIEATVASLRNSDEQLQGELKEIRENMARREDVTALGQRIDDALRARPPRKS